MKKLLILCSLLSVVGLKADKHEGNLFYDQATESNVQESTLEQLKEQRDQAWYAYLESPQYNDIYENYDRVSTDIGLHSQLEERVGQLYQQCLSVKAFDSTNQKPCDRYHKLNRKLQFLREKSLNEAPEKYKAARKTDEYKHYEDAFDKWHTAEIHKLQNRFN